MEKNKIQLSKSWNNTLIIFHNRNKDTYYYKIVSSIYPYYAGYINSYNHEILFRFDFRSLRPVYKVSLLYSLINIVEYLFKFPLYLLEKIKRLV